MTKSLPQTERKCTDCSNTKPVSDFHGKGVSSKGVKKYQSYCRSCANKRRRVRESKDLFLKEKRQKYAQKSNKQRTKESRKLEHDYFKEVKTLYGITKEQYLTLLKDQHNSCAICFIDFTNWSSKRRPHIDHDHETGVIRGILCGPCNMGIGQLKDSVDLLESAVRYLKKSLRLAE